VNFRGQDAVDVSVVVNFGQRPFIFDLTSLAMFVSHRTSVSLKGLAGYNAQVLAMNTALLLRKLTSVPLWRSAFERQMITCLAQLTPYLNATLAGPSPTPSSYSSSMMVQAVGCIVVLGGPDLVVHEGLRVSVPIPPAPGQLSCRVDALVVSYQFGQTSVTVQLDSEFPVTSLYPATSNVPSSSRHRLNVDLSDVQLRQIPSLDSFWLSSIASKVLSPMMPWFRAKENADRFTFIQHVRALIARVLITLASSKDTFLSVIRNESALSSLVDAAWSGQKIMDNRIHDLRSESLVFRRLIFEEVSRANLSAAKTAAKAKPVHTRISSADLVKFFSLLLLCVLAHCVI